MLENWSHLARRAVIVSDLVRHPGITAFKFLPGCAPRTS